MNISHNESQEEREIRQMVMKNLERIENVNQRSMEYADRIGLQNSNKRMNSKQTNQELFHLEKLRQNPLEETPLERRSRQYRNTIDKIKENDANAFRLFGLNRDFTLSQLKRKYIRLTKVSHPDMPGGSDEKFGLVTKFYLYLMDYYRREHSIDKYKNASRQNVNRSYDNILKSRGNQLENLRDSTKLRLGSGKDFDVNTFNTIFKKNQFFDPTHDGYGEWLKKSTMEDVKNAPKMFGKKFNMNVFNSAFEEQRRRQKTAIIAIDEVKSFNDDMADSGGVNLIDNGDNFGIRSNNLQAGDLKQVYSNGLLGVNPEHARREYRNTQEYERHRANRLTPFTMEEKQKEENRKGLFLQKEKTRLQKIAERDAAISDHYMRIQGLLQ